MKHTIPKDAEKSACRRCGETIFLIETRPGRIQPLDPDGYPHFSTCRREFAQQVMHEEATQCG